MLAEGVCGPLRESSALGSSTRRARAWRERKLAAPRCEGLVHAARPPAASATPVCDDATMRRRRALFLAWDYPHPQHATGAAVARRVRQIAWGFATHGWDVDVVIRDLFSGPEPENPVRVLTESEKEATIRIHCLPGPDASPTER